MSYNRDDKIKQPSGPGQQEQRASVCGIGAHTGVGLKRVLKVVMDEH